MIYRLYKAGFLATEANAAYYTNEAGQTISFLFDPDNTDYQAFLLWKSQGNEPLPADA